MLLGLGDVSLLFPGFVLRAVIECLSVVLKFECQTIVSFLASCFEPPCACLQRAMESRQAALSVRRCKDAAFRKRPTTLRQASARCVQTMRNKFRRCLQVSRIFCNFVVRERWKPHPRPLTPSLFPPSLRSPIADARLAIAPTLTPDLRCSKERGGEDAAPKLEEAKQPASSPLLGEGPGVRLYPGEHRRTAPKSPQNGLRIAVRPPRRYRRPSRGKNALRGALKRDFSEVLSP